MPGLCSGVGHWLGSVSESWLNWEGHMSESHCVVLTTINDADEAEILARMLLDERLAACVQIVGPTRSIFLWEGNLHKEREWQCWIKTSTDRLDALIEHLKKTHDYDEPEIIALPIVGGSADYLSWLTKETRPVSVDPV